MSELKAFGALAALLVFHGVHAPEIPTWLIVHGVAIAGIACGLCYVVRVLEPALVRGEEADGRAPE